jgi:phosphate transport system substrate-binding protein
MLLAACSSNGGSSTAASASAMASQSAGGSMTMDLSTVPPAPAFKGAISADGATFPQPVYEQWLTDYNAAYPDIQISYAGGGSGQGIKDITSNVVQWAGSDAPMKSDEQSAAESQNNTPIFHIPTVFGAIVMAYNLNGVTDPINFTPDTIGQIFTGKITKWSDPALKVDNPNINFPDQDITVVHRSDGSGTTNAFTNYLCEASTDWKNAVDPCAGKEVTWPVGLGGSGNPGVASTIASTPGSVGYIELAYALQNNIPFGNVKNKSGNFVTPSLDSVAAAANFSTIPDSLTFSAWNTDVADGYPITTATWILVYKEQDKVSNDQARSEAVVHFLIWALNKGGDDAKALDYAVLPDALRQAALERLATVTWNGTPIVNDLYK